jgi:hypothetical protein
MSQEILIELNGSLGQQLFQYAAGRSLSNVLGGRLSLAKTGGVDYRPVLFTGTYDQSLTNARMLYVQGSPEEPWTPERFRGVDRLYCKGGFQYLPALEPLLPLLKQELLVSLYSIRQQLLTKYNLQMRKRAAFAYVTANQSKEALESAIAALSLKKSIHIYIVTDDIAWAQSQLWLRGYTLVNESELHSLAFMSLCQGGSIGDSPLSWWGSFLSRA